MPSYKLVYFPIKGLAEPIRWLFSYANVEFVDERVDKDDWQAVKPTKPFGQLPVLEVDGKVINQSKAILRYLARQFKLAGKDDFENFQIDSAAENIYDMIAKINAPHYEKNEEQKAEKLKLAKETTPFYINRFEEQVKQNGGYFIGGKISYADIVFVVFLDTASVRVGYDIVEKAENLKALRDRVLSEPGIKKWIETRPKDAY